MSNPFLREIVPLPQPDSEVLETYQVTYEFHDEVRYRDALEEYCQWYYEVAAQHQQELSTMRREVNLFGLVARFRGR